MATRIRASAVLGTYTAGKAVWNNPPNYYTENTLNGKGVDSEEDNSTVTFGWLSGSASHGFYVNFGSINIPDNAIIRKVYCLVKADTYIGQNVSSTTVTSVTLQNGDVDISNTAGTGLFSYREHNHELYKLDVPVSNIPSITDFKNGNLRLGCDPGVGTYTTIGTIDGATLYVEYWIDGLPVNKLIVNGETKFDITGDNVTEMQVLQGFAFHLANGDPALGELIAEGSNLEFESGTYSPTSSMTEPTISFSKEHSKMPAFWYIALKTRASSSSASNFVTYIDLSQITGGQYNLYSTNYSSARDYCVVFRSDYRAAASLIEITHDPSSDTGTSSSSYPRYWTTPSYFIPRSNYSFRSGSIYEWFALWLPDDWVTE